MKLINLNEYRQVGEGGNGKTYVNAANPDEMLKVNRETLNDEATVRSELETAQHVFALGLSTPQMYEMVRVGDGYGLTFERIQGKKSLSRICADDPSRIGEAATILATEGKKLHATQCDTGFFPSRKAVTLKAIDAAEFCSEDDKAKLRAFVESLADETTCVHGDFQTGNLIVSGEGKPYWIDLGWFSYGSPWFDLGHLYLLCQVYSQFPTVHELFHMSREQMLQVWEAFAVAYAGSDHAAFDAQAAKFAALDVVYLSYMNPRPEANQMFAYVVHDFVEKLY
mgnify:CR=1 FL=1